MSGQNFLPMQQRPPHHTAPAPCAAWQGLSSVRARMTKALSTLAPRRASCLGMESTLTFSIITRTTWAARMRACVRAHTRPSAARAEPAVNLYGPRGAVRLHTGGARESSALPVGPLAALACAHSDARHQRSTPVAAPLRCGMRRLVRTPFFGKGVRSIRRSRPLSGSSGVDCIAVPRAPSSPFPHLPHPPPPFKTSAPTWRASSVLRAQCARRRPPGRAA